MNSRLLLSRVLPVFVLLSVLFSSICSVYASTTTNLEPIELEPIQSDSPVMMMSNNVDTSTGEYLIRQISHYGEYNDTQGFSNAKYFIDWNTSSIQLDFNKTTVIRESLASVNPFDYYFRDQYIISHKSGTRLAKKGESLSISLTNILKTAIATNSDGETARYSYFKPNLTVMYLYVYDANGTSHLVKKITSGFNIRTSTNKVDIGGDFDNLPCDVYKANIVLIYDPMQTYNNNDGDTSIQGTSWIWPKIKLGWGYADGNLSISVDDNSAGLLSAIIEFVKSILEGVTKIFGKLGDFMSSVGGWFSTLFDNIASFMSSVGSWFGTLFDHILELPGIVWNLFENGLKSLFVPDDDFMSAYYDNYQTLFEDRFGLLYDCGEVVNDFVDRVNINTVTDTITLPSITVNLADTPFTFGGYTVKVIPDGFGSLVNVCKSITSIICTLLFVNTMKRRFTGILERG